MSKFERDYTINAISEGTVNPKIVKQFFYDIKLKSYDYCHLIQRELIGLRKHHEPDVGKCISNTEVVANCFETKAVRVVNFPVPFELVHISKRKNYHYSKYYNKVLSYEDLENGKEIFKYTPLFYINNNIFTDIRFKCRDDVTYIYTRYDKFSFTDINENTKIDTQFLSKSLLDEYTLTGTEIANKHISISVFKHPEDIINIDKYMGYFVKDNKYIFIKEISLDKESKELVFDVDIPTQLAGYKLVLIGLGNFLERRDFGPSDKFFSVGFQKMPTPKDNMLIMLRSDDGLNYYPNDGSVEIKEYYPNIYEISNPSARSFTVYILYDKTDEVDGIEYDKEIEYYLSKVNLLERYQSNTVPAVLREYKPISWDYLIRDFHDKYTDETWFTEDKYNAFRYKLEKVSDIYKLWCLFFQVFVRRTYGFLPGFLMDMSQMNIEEKIRTDTSKELPLSSNIYKKFDTEQVMFSYRNTDLDGENVSYIFYIDGYMRYPTAIYTYKGYTYVYIDKAYIKEDTFIEVERFDGVKFELPLKVEDGPIEVSLEFLNTTILANALFLVDDQGNYFNLDDENPDYLISVIDIIGTFDIKNKDSVYILTPLCKLRITPLNDNAKNRNIELRCNNRYMTFDAPIDHENDYIGDEDGFEYIFKDLNTYSKIANVRPGVRARLRIYNSDGRMFSKRLIKDSNIRQGTNVNDKIDIAFPICDDSVPFVTLAYIGYDERLVYRQSKIETKNVINLEGKIPRPFSLTYYDVYLSGIKLNRHNIEIVSPFYIYLKDVATIDDFEIYEKLRPADTVYSFDEDEESDYIGDNLFKDDDEFREDVIDGIEEIIPDPDTGDLDDLVDDFINLIVDFILKEFINADLSYDLSDYEDYFDPEHGWRLYLNADHRLEKEIPKKYWVYLNHDWTLKSNDEPEEP